jgi:uncharacterized protein
VHLRRRSLLAGGFAGLLAQLGRPRAARAAGGYGALVPDPDGLLDLPPGFRYHIVDRRGDVMDDGYRVPALPDGMAAFPGPDGQVVLVRNHELVADDGPYDVGDAPPEAYDPAAMGCVTRVVLDGETFARVASNLVLCGTMMNCAGGPTPWGWLTCEETSATGHGYVFLCDPTAARVQPPRRLPALGRCEHEAACVDPATGIIYMTEDQPDSCFYRFVPDDPAEPFVGRLQALRVVGHDTYATTGLPQATAAPVAGVDLADPDATGTPLRAAAQALGAAVFVRGEGLTFADGEVFLTATTGGPGGHGQIFRLVDDPDAPILEAFIVADDPDVVDGPDNITPAPWGGELFFGEDGGGGNAIRVVGADGLVHEFARNVGEPGELSGVCFSPDGRALFVNVHKRGLTLAITGPFPGTPGYEPPPQGKPSRLPEDDDDDPDACACRSGPGAGGAALAAALALAAPRPRPRTPP